MRPPPPPLPAGDEVLSSSRAVPRYPAHCAVCLGISVEKKFKSYSEKAQEWGPVCLGCWVGRERGLPSVPHLIPSSKETRDSEHKGGGPARSRRRKSTPRPGLSAGRTEMREAVFPLKPHQRRKFPSNRLSPCFSLRLPTTWAPSRARRVLALQPLAQRGHAPSQATRTHLSGDLRGRTPRREEQGQLGQQSPQGWAPVGLRSKAPPSACVRGPSHAEKGNESQRLFQKILTIQSRDCPPQGEGHMCS